MGIFTYESRYLRQIALGTHPNGQPFSGPDWVAVSSSWVYHCPPAHPPEPLWSVQPGFTHLQNLPGPRGQLIWRPSLFLTSLSLLGPQGPSFSCSLVTPETHQPRPSNGHSVQGPAAPPGSTQEEDTMDTARLAPSPSLPFGLSFLLIWGTLFRLRRQEALLAQHLCPASGPPPGPILSVLFPLSS